MAIDDLAAIPAVQSVLNEEVLFPAFLPSPQNTAVRNESAPQLTGEEWR